jgi:hypothetical protein
MGGCENSNYLRTSKGLTTDDISPYSQPITTNKEKKLSHQTKKTRFRIDVGVSMAAMWN